MEIVIFNMKPYAARAMGIGNLPCASRFLNDSLSGIYRISTPDPKEVYTAGGYVIVYTMRLLSCSFFRSVMSSCVYGQTTQRLLKLYFDEVRAGKYKTIPQNLSLPEEGQSTLSSIESYLRDTSSVLRAYAIVQLKSTASPLQIVPLAK